jgi:hypothetical protein
LLPFKLGRSHFSYVTLSRKLTDSMKIAEFPRTFHA